MSSEYNVPVRPLDVALYQRRGVLGWIISAITGSPWVHAAPIVRMTILGAERTLVCDARLGGIALRPLSSDVLRGERIRLLRAPGDILSPQEAAALAAFVFSRLGMMEYATLGFIANGAAEVVGVWSHRDPRSIPSRVICSEWVSALLRKFLEFDPCQRFPDAYTTPADLNRGMLRLVTPLLRLEA